MADTSHGTPPVHMPDPTPWPMVMALGITFMPAGILLGPRLGAEGTLLGLVPVVSVLGLILFCLALYKMIRADLEHEGQGAH